MSRQVPDSSKLYASDAYDRWLSEQLPRGNCNYLHGKLGACPSRLDAYSRQRLGIA
ncbi:hypothetical protein GK047_15530 [Paenibacillus sp. SYP-B3998]|uniref:Uncharacterized protein n=1 Tax=Paenibacillus sp. SYP-B3998 TaxID=2678564 RepID=A0A6G3ZZ74_9BACL|nr:hypothetical protein [Paenibacillus sp. SYP-B3998]NEW07415.1 hypothetical protein [Paenibacillus sp. SYP-B3998]